MLSLSRGQRSGPQRATSRYKLIGGRILLWLEGQGYTSSFITRTYTKLHQHREQGGRRCCLGLHPSFHQRFAASSLASRRFGSLLNVGHYCDRHGRLAHACLQAVVDRDARRMGRRARRGMMVLPSACVANSRQLQRHAGQALLTLVTLPTHISFSLPLLWRAITMHSAFTSCAWAGRGPTRLSAQVDCQGAVAACATDRTAVGGTEKRTGARTCMRSGKAHRCTSRQALQVQCRPPTCAFLRITLLTLSAEAQWHTCAHASRQAALTGCAGKSLQHCASCMQPSLE